MATNATGVDEGCLRIKAWVECNAQSKAEKQGIFCSSFMDDVVILTKTRWKLEDCHPAGASCSA